MNSPGGLCKIWKESHLSTHPKVLYLLYFCISAQITLLECILVWASRFCLQLSSCSLSSHCDFQPQERQHSAWNYSGWTRSKTLLVHNSFHSKNVVKTIWLNRVASWLGQWVAEDLLVFSYLSQLRVKANIQAHRGLETQPLQTLTCGHKSQPRRCLCQVSLAGCQYCPAECRWGMGNRWIIKYFLNY